MNITDITKVTKGDIITEVGGRTYTVLGKAAQPTGTERGDGEANYALMVRGTGRAFDLIFTQGTMNRGVYTATRG